MVHLLKSRLRTVLEWVRNLGLNGPTPSHHRRALDGNSVPSLYQNRNRTQNHLLAHAAISNRTGTVVIKTHNSHGLEIS